MGVMDLISSLSVRSPVSVEQNENRSICKVLRSPCQSGTISVQPKLEKGEALPNRNHVAQLISRKQVGEAKPVTCARRQEHQPCRFAANWPALGRSRQPSRLPPQHL